MLHASRIRVPKALRAPKISPPDARVAANARLRTALAARGLEFNTPDPAPFRKQLAGVYAAWKERLGPKCWTLLEDSVSKVQT
jgi:hypothetical protein